MSRGDIFLLAIMSSKNKLPLSKIVEKVEVAEIYQVPSKLAIYKKLHVLKKHEGINTLWGKTGKKLYTISPTGISVITELKNQLERAQLV